MQNRSRNKKFWDGLSETLLLPQGKPVWGHLVSETWRSRTSRPLHGRIWQGPPSWPAHPAPVQPQNPGGTQGARSGASTQPGMAGSWHWDQWAPRGPIQDLENNARAQQLQNAAEGPPGSPPAPRLGVCPAGHGRAGRQCSRSPHALAQRPWTCPSQAELVFLPSHPARPDPVHHVPKRFAHKCSLPSIPCPLSPTPHPLCHPMGTGCPCHPKWLWGARATMVSWQGGGDGDGGLGGGGCRGVGVPGGCRSRVR